MKETDLDMKRSPKKNTTDIVKDSSKDGKMNRLTPDKKDAIEDVKKFVDYCEEFLEVNKEKYYAAVDMNQDAIREIRRLNRSKNTGLFIFAGIVLAIKNLDWSFLTITKPAKRMLEEYWFSKGKIREYNEVRVDFIDMKDLYEKLRKVHEVE